MSCDISYGEHLKAISSPNPNTADPANLAGEVLNHLTRAAFYGILSYGLLDEMAEGNHDLRSTALLFGLGAKTGNIALKELKHSANSAMNWRKEKLPL